MDNRQIVYIAELDNDVDDVIAAEYIHNKGALKCVVVDPKPSTKAGIWREKQLKRSGITVVNNIPLDTKYVFCGGALTKIAKHIRKNSLEALVMNGGFVGCNIVENSKQLNKFKDKQFVRTFNFNVDVKSTDEVLKSSKEQIADIYLIGKNVCHDRINSNIGLWKDKESLELFEKYSVREGKLQHDMLACHEGLVKLGFIDEKQYCLFKEVYPDNKGLAGNKTLWGSSIEPTVYRKVQAAYSLDTSNLPI